MKKLLAVLLLVLLVLAAVFYFVMPPSTITQRVVLKAYPAVVYRCLTDPKLLRQWWGDSNSTVTVASNIVHITSAERTYTISPQPFNVVGVVVNDSGKPVESFITMATLPGDTTVVSWKAEVPSNNLLARFQNSWRVPQLKADMYTRLQQLQQFMQSEKNRYGIAVQQTKVTDTLLAVTRIYDTIPATVETYYGLIKKLRDEISRQDIQETNYPMLNILKIDSVRYQTMVAIPVNKSITDKGAIVSKRMIPGDILVAEVHGGPAAIRKGFQQLDLYATEHRFTQPAIPFQSLVTDRLAERDTAKWITRLYYPVE